MKNVIFVATTPFAVNAFLKSHLIALSDFCSVTLCVNLDAYELDPQIVRHVTVIHLDIERRISPRADIKALLQLVRIVGSVEPVAIHSLTPKAGLLAMLAGALLRVPHRFHTFTGQVWATKRGLPRILLKSLDKLIASLASKVFADSASQCRLLELERVVPPGAVRMLGAGSISGVNLGRFKPDPAVRAVVRQDLACDDVCCVFLFVGRMTRDKGVFDLVEAFANLEKRGLDVRLWIAGPDEEAVRQQIRSSPSGQSDRIWWIGRTKTPERYMAAADVLVLPSYREGFGSVIIEAAACSVPAIAYRIDGVVDAIDDGHTGKLVPLADLASLESAMRDLALNPESRVRLGAAAWDRARKRFSSELVTSAWVDFYRQELSSAG